VRVQKNIKQLVLDDCGLDNEAFIELEELVSKRGTHGLASLSLWHNSITAETKAAWEEALQGHDTLVQVDLPSALVNQELAKPSRASEVSRLDYPLG
jgi:hypothetical protein